MSNAYVNSCDDNRDALYSDDARIKEMAEEMAIEEALSNASVGDLIAALGDLLEDGKKPSVTEYRDLMIYVGGAI